MATVTLGRYVFEEEPGRLQVLDSVGEHVGCLIVSALVALGGVGGLGAVLVLAGPAKVGWWLLATGPTAVLGISLLSRLIAKGRTIWTIDRESGEVLHRGKFLRSLSSITHLTVFGVELPQTRQFMHYVEFAPSQGQNLWSTFLAGFLGLSARLGSGSRKERLAFQNLKDSSQAATMLAAFLGVGIVAESVTRP